MKKIFLLFIALLFISGFKAEEQPQNVDKKEQQAAEISNFVFLKIRDSFILLGVASNVRLYFNFNLNMPLDVANQEVSSVRKEIVNELGDEYLKKLNANGFLNSKILLFKESLKKKFNEEEINEISIYIPSKSISLNVYEGKFAFLRDNKKFTKFLDKYRFSELYYEEVSKLITPSFSIELFDSLKSILEKHGYKEGYEFNTNPLVLQFVTPMQFFSCLCMHICHELYLFLLKANTPPGISMSNIESETSSTLQEAFISSKR